MERVGSDFDPKGSCLKISLYIATRTRAKRERWKKTKDEQAGISWDEQREKGWKDEVEEEEEEEEEEEVDKSVERRKNRDREREGERWASAKKTRVWKLEGKGGIL